MNWNKKEILNQIAHTFIGILTTYLILWITLKIGIDIIDLRLLIVGLIVGTLVEIKQYFFDDNRELKLLDRIRYVAFYVFGSFLIWIWK